MSDKTITAYCTLFLERVTPNIRDIICTKGICYKIITITETEPAESLQTLVDAGVFKMCEVTYDYKNDRYNFVKWIK